MTQDIKESASYKKLLKLVQDDEVKTPGLHDYAAKLNWIVERAKHYAEKAGMTPTEVLDGWERDRDYWYMNYYQDAHMPPITEERVRIFETINELNEAIADRRFRCPACGGVSTHPYVCNSGILIEGEPCNWKVYGLFQDLGKGLYIFVKEKAKAELIFMPIAFENESQNHS